MSDFTFTARIYRFGDQIAIDIPERYISPLDALKIANALRNYAEDIDHNKFTDSLLGTVEIVSKGDDE